MDSAGITRRRSHEVHDQLSSFSPTAKNPVGVNGALVFGGTGTGRTGDQFYQAVEIGLRSAPRHGVSA